MTTIYKTHSHNRNSTPDGRESVFTGTPEECDRYYNELSQAQRCSDRYRFSDDGSPDSAVDYLDWSHAGCTSGV
jgi:hypothetical protein